MTINSLPDPTDNRIGGFRSNGQPTEREAAIGVATTSGKQRVRVLRELFNAPDGLTDYELGVRMGNLRTSAGKRRGELMADGWVQKHPLGLRRPTDTGKTAIVWTLTPAAQANKSNLDIMVARRKKVN